MTKSWREVQSDLMKTDEVKTHRKRFGDHLYPNVCTRCLSPILNEKGRVTYHYDIDDDSDFFCDNCRQER